jgi:hypothetical protein
MGCHYFFSKILLTAALTILTTVAQSQTPTPTRSQTASAPQTGTVVVDGFAELVGIGVDLSGNVYFCGA